MVDCGDKLWKDGKLVEADSCRLPLLTHSLHYGVGVFEGIRAYRGPDGRAQIFRLSDHVARLYDSCRLVHLEPQPTPDEVCAGCVTLLRYHGWEDAYLRPLVVLGEGAMGLFPSANPVWTFVVAWRWGAYLGSDALEHGIRVTISSHSRQHIRAVLPRAKVSGYYVTSVLAKQEAKARGFDEALLLDCGGHVAEGSGENLFVVRRGKLLTPPLSGSILDGLTRDTVMTLAGELGIEVLEQSLLRDDLYLADEVFLTGTAAEVTPVVQVDDRAIGDGKPGPISRVLQEQYFSVVRGANGAHAEWRTEV